MGTLNSCRNIFHGVYYIEGENVWKRKVTVDNNLERKLGEMWLGFYGNKSVS